MNYHVVKPGDTIYKLAQMYNVSVEAIIEANPGINPNMLTIGQIICIPLGPKEECPPGTSSYTIRKGDTLYLIAKKYDIPLNLLIKSNPNVNPNNLIVGEFYVFQYIGLAIRVSYIGFLLNIHPPGKGSRGLL